MSEATRKEYKTRGVCARTIHFETADNRVKNVSFGGGCHGNLQGISALIEDMPIEEVIKRLDGIKCERRSTSCPDQLAQALKMETL